MVRQSRYKASQKQFETLFAEALSLYSAGDPRRQARADKFFEAVHAAPLVWTKHRFFAFTSALALKADRDYGKKNDIDFMNTVMEQLSSIMKMNRLTFEVLLHFGLPSSMFTVLRS
jgi:hypothetical protein